MKGHLTVILFFLFSCCLLHPINIKAQINTESNPIEIRFDPEYIQTSKVDDFAYYTWANYLFDWDSLELGTYQLEESYLFPDSISILVSDSTSAHLENVKYHSIGNTLDLKSENIKFTDPPGGGSTCDWYSVDSFAIYYKYVRLNPDFSFFDTLEATFYIDDPGNLPVDFLTDSSLVNYYSIDTLYYLQQLYDYASNSPIAVNKYTFKIPLGGSDTTSTFKWLRYPTEVPGPYNIYVNGDYYVNRGFVGSAFKFIPGYNYLIKDTLNVSGNYFQFASFESNGDSSYPQYNVPTTNYCNGFELREWNISSVVTTDILHNQDSVWNGIYKPSYAFDSLYKLDHHIVSYFVNWYDGGVYDSEEHFFHVYPNPFEDELTIVNPTNQIYDLTLYDILGRKVKKFTSNSSGRQTFDMINLSAGTYFVRIFSADNIFDEVIKLSKMD